MSQCIAWEQLDAIAEDWPTDFLEIYTEFVAALPSDLNELQQAVASGEGQRVAAVAHRIKGSSGNFGFAGVSTVAAQIETLAKKGKLSEVGELPKRAANLFEEAREEVRNRLRSLGRELEGC